MICIGASDLRVIGRNTQGVRLFRLKDGDKLVSAALLEPEEEAPEVELDEEGNPIVVPETVEGESAAPQEPSTEPSEEVDSGEG